MLKASSLPGKGRIWVFLLTALLVVAADQLAKLWVRSNLAIGESLPETGFFRLSHVQNTGAVFGLFQDQSSLLTLLSLVAVVAILVFALFIKRFPFLDNMPGKLALGLILGGTTANLIDRLSLGYVTDFIDVGPWPVFNIADSAAVIGEILLVYLLLRLAKSWKRSHEQGI